MAVDKKFFVDINLQGSALNNATIGSNSDMTKGGSFRFDGTRLEYYDGSSVQSVANLADIAAVTGGLILQGGYDAATNTPDIADGSALKGFFWVVTEAGSFLGESVQVGDSIIAKEDGAGASIGDWLILQGNVVIATDSVDGIVRLATQAEVDSGTEGGAVVLTPATFANSQQLADINNNIAGLANDKLAIDGSQAMTGNLDMGNNRIEKLSAPVSGNDAANKDYVDTTAAAAQAAAEATASADATAKADAAEANAKAYADSLAPNYDPAGSAATAESNANSYTDSVAATKLDLAGGTMSGNLNMGTLDIENVGTVITSSVAGLNSSAVYLTYGADANNNKITNLSNPTDQTDATNKDYVDGAAATAQSNAESFATTAANQALSDANSYTDTQIAAQSFSATYADTDWTLSGGVYSLRIEHAVNTLVPKVSCNVAGNLVEFGVVVVNVNKLDLQSNITPPASITVGLSK